MKYKRSGGITILIFIHQKQEEIHKQYETTNVRNDRLIYKADSFKTQRQLSPTNQDIKKSYIPTKITKAI